MDTNLMIINLTFYQNCNFLADTIRWNGDFLLSSVESKPKAADAMRARKFHSEKLKSEIKQIGGLMKSLSEHGRVWT